METLAYIHLALANEAPASTDDIAFETNWESPKLFEKLTGQKLSVSTAVHLLALSVALGVVGMARQASALVKQGDRGSEVTTLQQRLKDLGFFKASVTGYFGSATKDALIQFQQAKGLTPDGVAGTSTEASLGDSSTSSKPERESSNPRPQLRKESSGHVLQLGDRGSQVSALQESLARAGLPSGARGIFDEATQDAVRQFQQTKGLTPDGIVGSQTMAALPGISGSNPTSDLNSGSSRSDIQALQKRLQEQGFYRGSIDGIWGSQTQAAVAAAQKAYKVSSTELKNGGY